MQLFYTCMSFACRLSDFSSTSSTKILAITHQQKLPQICLSALSVLILCSVFLFVCLSASYVYLSTLSVSLLCLSLLFVSSVYSVCSVFLFVCLSASYVYLSILSVSLLCMSLLFVSSVHSVCSVFLLWMSALFSAPSEMSVCPSYLSAQSDLCACPICLLCLSAMSAMSVLSFCSVCLQRMSSPPPSPPSKQMWISGYKEQAIWN